MSFIKQNEQFEQWLRSQCAVVDADLEKKHRRMRKDAMSFLRATYFYWAQEIESICGNLEKAPQVLAVGDIHVENFGTWRDAEGRLVWGVNDFDEAAVMPYALDLVRLATSVRLFPDRILPARRACDAILLGYRRGLSNPRPTLLDEHAAWMRPMVACTDGDRRQFWRDIDELHPSEPSDEVRKALASALPNGAQVQFHAPRARGGGSLGRPRFVVVAAYQGGRIAREAKALVPSAWDWAHGGTGDIRNFTRLATGRCRSPDPHLDVRGTFIVRRIAADSRKLDLTAEGNSLVDERILSAMGADLAAIHCADQGKAGLIEKDLENRPEDWLHKNARLAAAWAERTYEGYVKNAANPKGSKGKAGTARPQIS
ncbi:hypothetical protein LMIY3S_05629 [Labrys miyagiensis]